MKCRVRRFQFSTQVQGTMVLVKRFITVLINAVIKSSLQMCNTAHVHNYHQFAHTVSA